MRVVRLCGLFSCSGTGQCSEFVTARDNASRPIGTRNVLRPVRGFGSGCCLVTERNSAFGALNGRMRVD